MNCWNVLDLEPTTNKREIKLAYTEKLKLCRPDKDPEGFKQLRKAFENALNESRFLEESNKSAQPIAEEQPAHEGTEEKETQNIRIETEDITTIAALYKAMNQLYQDLEKRHLTEHWEALFNSPVSTDLDNFTAYENCVLGFFCSGPFLPFEVFDTFARHFRFNEDFTRFENTSYYNDARYLYYYLQTRGQRMAYPDPAALPAELEKHLKILSNRRTIEDAIIFNGLNGEQLFALFHELELAQNDKELRMYLSRNFLYEGSPDYAIKLIEEVELEQPGGEEHAILGESFYRLNDYAQALTHFQLHARDTAPDIPETTNKGIALCMAGMGQDETAIELLEPLVVKRTYDFELRMHLSQVRKRLIARYEKAEAAEEKVRLGQILFNAGRYEACLSLLEPLKYFLQNQSNPLLAKCYARMGNYVDAGHEFSHIIQGARARKENVVDLAAEYILFCEPDLGPKQFKSIVMPELKKLIDMGMSDAEYAYILALIFNRYYTVLNPNEEEKKICEERWVYFIDKATTLDPINTSYHYLRTGLMYRGKNYEEAIRSGELARTSNYMDYWINYMLSISYFYVRDFSRAANRIEFTLDLKPDTESQFSLIDKLITCHAKLGNGNETVKWLRKMQEFENKKPGFAYLPLFVLFDAYRYSSRSLPTFVPEYLLEIMRAPDGLTAHDYKKHGELFHYMLQYMKDGQEEHEEQFQQLEEAFNSLNNPL